MESETPLECPLLPTCRGPDGMKKFVGLGAKRCAPCEAGKAVKLASGDVTRLRNQVPGWKLTEDAGGVQCLRQEWKVKNFTSGGFAQGDHVQSAVCGCVLQQCLSGPYHVGCMATADCMVALCALFFS